MKRRLVPALLLLFGNVAITVVAVVASLLLRFGHDAASYAPTYLPLLLTALLVRPLVFAGLGFLHPRTHGVDSRILLRLMIGTAIGSGAVGAVAIAPGMLDGTASLAFPRSVILLEAGFYFALTLAFLFIRRVSITLPSARKAGTISTIIIILLGPLHGGSSWHALPERWPTRPSSNSYEPVVAEALEEWRQSKPAYTPALGTYKPVEPYLHYGRSELRESDRLRFDEDGIPQHRYGDQFYYNPVGVAQYALALHARYSRGQESAAPFLAAVDVLVGLQDERGAFPYPFEWRYYLSGETYEPGWVSAMAQGQALSALSRAWEQSREHQYLESGQKALAFLLTPISKGGVMGDLRYLDGSLRRYIFFEEYVSEPNAYTLNGYMFTLLGLYDWSKLRSRDTSVGRAGDAFARGIETLRRLLPYYDIGGFSSYDLGHLTYGKEPHVAARYHAVHIYQLHALHSITDEPLFKRYERLWISYVSGIGSERSAPTWTGHNGIIGMSKTPATTSWYPFHATFALGHDDWVSELAQHAKALGRQPRGVTAETLVPVERIRSSSSRILD